MNKIYLLQINQRLTATGAKTLDWLYIPKAPEIVDKNNGLMELVHTKTKLYMLVLIEDSMIDLLEDKLVFVIDKTNVTEEVKNGEVKSKILKEFNLPQFQLKL